MTTSGPPSFSAVEVYNLSEQNILADFTEFVCETLWLVNTMVIPLWNQIKLMNI